MNQAQAMQESTVANHAVKSTINNYKQIINTTAQEVSLPVNFFQLDMLRQRDENRRRLHSARVENDDPKHGYNFAAIK